MKKKKVKKMLRKMVNKKFRKLAEEIFAEVPPVEEEVDITDEALPYIYFTYKKKGEA